MCVWFGGGGENIAKLTQVDLHEFRNLGSVMIIHGKCTFEIMSNQFS